MLELQLWVLKGPIFIQYKKILYFYYIMHTTQKTYQSFFRGVTFPILLVVRGKYNYWQGLFNSLKTAVLGTEPSLLLTTTDL